MWRPRTNRRRWCGGRAKKRAEPTDLWPNNHDFCGLDQSGDGLAIFQAHFANRIGGYDRRDSLAADRHGDLGDQAVNLYAGHPADELVAPADSPEVRPSVGNVSALAGSIQKSVHFPLGNAVVPSGSLHAANFLLIDPLLERGITDSKHLGCFPWSEEFGGRHNDTLDSPAGYY
jgi:hypothetical protein